MGFCQTGIAFWENPTPPKHGCPIPALQKQPQFMALPINPGCFASLACRRLDAPPYASFAFSFKILSIVTSFTQMTKTSVAIFKFSRLGYVGAIRMVESVGSFP